MKRVPAARLFWMAASACLIFLDGSILLAATSQNQKGSPPAQSGKPTPTQANKTATPQASKAKNPSRVEVRQKSTKKEQPKRAGRSAGIYHVVRKGQTLFGISRAYHVSIESLVRANGLSKPSALRIGQRLFIPGARLTQRVEPFKPLTGRQRVEIARALETENAEEAEPAQGAEGFHSLTDPLKETSIIPSTEEESEPGSPIEAPPEEASTSSSGSPAESIAEADSEDFIWPLINRITSRFGPRGRRMHTGVDIAAPSYHEVLAAADGEVIMVQHSRRGLGNAVVLQHDNGYRTLYGHGVVILVKEGDTVKRGEPIMGVGNTGRSTGNHLHFEIRKDGIPINPLRLMPPTLDELIEDLRAEKKAEGPS